MSCCIGYAPASGWACTRDAVDTVIAGCVHEHIGPRRLCQYHIADLAEGRMHCGNCRDGREPHECVLVALPVRARA